MKTFTSALSAILLPFAGVSTLFLVSACGTKDKPTTPVAHTVAIDNGSMIPINVRVYIVNIKGVEYYATESAANFFTLCPINK